VVFTANLPSAYPKANTPQSRSVAPRKTSIDNNDDNNNNNDEKHNSNDTISLGTLLLLLVEPPPRLDLDSIPGLSQYLTTLCDAIGKLPDNGAWYTHFFSQVWGPHERSSTGVS